MVTVTIEQFNFTQISVATDGSLDSETPMIWRLIQLDTARYTEIFF